MLFLTIIIFASKISCGTYWKCLTKTIPMDIHIIFWCKNCVLITLLIWTHGWQLSLFEVQTTLVISNSKGLSETLRDIRTSTYQIFRIEEKVIRTTTFNKFMYIIGLLKLEIYQKYCGKEEKLLLRSNFSSFPQYFLLVVRFVCLGRDKIFTSR